MHKTNARVPAVHIPLLRPRRHSALCSLHGQISSLQAPSQLGSATIHRPTPLSRCHLLTTLQTHKFRDSDNPANGKPLLSRTKLIFHDFTEPEILEKNSMTFQDFLGCVGTLDTVWKEKVCL